MRIESCRHESNVIEPTSLFLRPGTRGRRKAAALRECLLYVGTFTEKKSQGIYAYHFDVARGQITSLGLAAETVNPAFLVLHPNGRFLYAVKEVYEIHGVTAGAVRAFAIDQKTGGLRFLNEVTSGGTGPCHVALDKTAKYLLVANYSSGSAEVVRVRRDGRLGKVTAFVQHAGSGVNLERQEGPHAHSINVSPDNRFALVADLGLDEILVYRFDASRGTLTPHHLPYAKVSPGSGPRHLAFAPNRKYVYVINEMKSTVSVFSYQTTRETLHEVQTVSTLPRRFKGESTTAEIALLSSGKFLYGSNRGHDSITVFAVDPRRGTLSRIASVPTQGRTPRHFAIDPTDSYLFVANQDSDNTVVFRINPKTGRLTSTGQVLEVASPVCVRFVPLN